MSKSIRVISIVVIISAVLLTACSNASSDAPAAVMQAYWQAMADKDSAALSSLTCADYEGVALSTLDSFQAVETKLADLTCSTSSQEGDAAEVTCQGSLEASYGAEISSFDLSVYTFKLVKQGGDWLMCGE